MRNHVTLLDINPKGHLTTSLCAHFPDLLGLFTSVTYPGRTGEKLLRSDHVTRNALAAHNSEA